MSRDYGKALIRLLQFDPEKLRPDADGQVTSGQIIEAERFLEDLRAVFICLHRPEEDFRHYTDNPSRKIDLWG